jgi:hypothetical protein
MEWVLQVVDEIDDAIGALRLCSLGLAAEFGLVAAGSLGIATPRQTNPTVKSAPTPL